MCGGDGGGGNVFLDFIAKKHMAESATKMGAEKGSQPSETSVPGKGSASKIEGRRQTGPSASGFKGTDKRGDLVSGDRKKSVDKKTLLGG
jgi:hypothetical protein